MSRLELFKVGKRRNVTQKYYNERENKIIIADFAAPEATNSKFFRAKLDQVRDLDTSIVIANAGLLAIGPLCEVQPFQLQSMLDVYVYHYTLIAKVFLPWLFNKRTFFSCAFSSVSNSSYLRFMPCFFTYTATKAFATSLIEGV